MTKIPGETMNKYHVFNIEYDNEVDGEKVDVSHLPTKFIFELHPAEMEGLEKDEIATLLGDKVSGETGFCIYGCEYEEIKV